MMNNQDLTGNQLYLKELNKGKPIAFKRAVIFFSTVIVMFSIAGMVEV